MLAQRAEESHSVSISTTTYGRTEATRSLTTTMSTTCRLICGHRS